MKKLLIINTLMLLIMTNAHAQQNDEQAIKTVISSFAAAAENHDVTAMNNLLEENFRVVLNQMFGSDKVTLLDKKAYLGMLGEKKLGGDKNVIDTKSVTIIKNNAFANTVFKGEKMTMQLFLHMVKTKEGNWKIVEDLPTVL